MKRITFRCTMLIALIIGLVYITPVQPAHASSLVVNSLADTNDGSCDNLGTGSGNQDCTLREAIEVASSGDTITFSVTGTIKLGGTQLNINKNLTITGPGPSQLTVSGENASRIFVVTGDGITVSISGMTIDKGFGQNSKGAGVSASSSTSSPISLTLDHVVISNCINATLSGGYPHGGGVGMDGGILTITNSTISGNSAGYSGGGIAIMNDSSANMTNVIVDNNQVTDPSGSGGGVSLKSNPGFSSTLSNVTISNNKVTGTSGIGGGLYVQYHTLTLTQSTVTLNSAGDDGGGLYLFDSTTNINSSTINGNNTTGLANSDGGGIVNLGNGSTSALTIINSTLFGNTANHGTGGAIYNQASGGSSSNVATIIAKNSTIVGNNAGASNSGGGIYVSTAGGSEISTFTLSNSIVYGNTISSGIIGENCNTVNSAIINASSHNLFQDLVNDCTAGVTDIKSSAATSAIVNSLGNYGGTTQTMSLPVGSPAIDTGDDTVCADINTVNNLDQRGLKRPYGIHCDIGAFEQVYRLFLPLILR
jgi:CSLREA domain-containing protein